MVKRHDRRVKRIMLSFRDCLDMTEVTEGEIDAIVKHRHIPPIVALELGHQLLQTSEGREKLRDIITDDVHAAQVRHRCGECERFSLTLSRYLETYSRGDDSGATVSQRLAELAAIGVAEEREGEPEKMNASGQDALQALNEAKDRSDCCACARLSLELVHATRDSG
jgi:hypothetical protein